MKSLKLSASQNFLKYVKLTFTVIISLINNIVSEDKLKILEKFGNSSNTEVNASEIERFIDEKFGEIITTNTEKKSHCYREI